MASRSGRRRGTGSSRSSKAGSRPRGGRKSFMEQLAEKARDLALKRITRINLEAWLARNGYSIESYWELYGDPRFFAVSESAVYRVAVIRAGDTVQVHVTRYGRGSSRMFVFRARGV